MNDSKGEVSYETSATVTGEFPWTNTHSRAGVCHVVWTFDGRPLLCALFNPMPLVPLAQDMYINLHLHYAEHYPPHPRGSVPFCGWSSTWYDPFLLQVDNNANITRHDEIIDHAYLYVLFIACVALLRISSPAITGQSVG